MPKRTWSRRDVLGLAAGIGVPVAIGAAGAVYFFSIKSQSKATDLHQFLTLPTEGNTLSAAWSPDGERIATVDGKHEEIRVWNASTGKLMQSYPSQSGALPLSVVWSSDGQSILALMEDRNSSLLQIWDVMSGQCICPITGLPPFSP